MISLIHYLAYRYFMKGLKKPHDLWYKESLKETRKMLTTVALVADLFLTTLIVLTLIAIYYES